MSREAHGKAAFRYAPPRLLVQLLRQDDAVGTGDCAPPGGAGGKRGEVDRGPREMDLAEKKQDNQHRRDKPTDGVDIEKRVLTRNAVPSVAWLLGQCPASAMCA
jgi:hypothetical protein